MAVVQNQWYHFGIGAPPILEPTLVVGLNRMFTEGQPIWLLTHGHIAKMGCVVLFWVLVQRETNRKTISLVHFAWLLGLQFVAN